MHSMIIVIGDDPEQRARALELPMGDTDWAAIGGRFQQRLTPVAAATTGRVSGDAMPPFEAKVLGMLPEGVEGRRGIDGPARGRGVDQLRRFDLDVTATIRDSVPGYVLDEGGQLHSAEFTDDEDIALFATSLPGGDLSKLDVDVDWTAMEAKAKAWERRVAELLAAAAPGALISVIDVHM